MNTQVHLSRVFDSSVLMFLKESAVEGETLETVICSVFDEMYAEENGPTLAKFALIILNEMKMKRVLAMSLLEALHPAAERKRSIYDMVDVLERKQRRKLCIPISNGLRPHNKLLGHAL